MKKPIYVIGHKNADCDSICSAISYAYLKQQLQIHAVAGRLSGINSETRFVLDKFGFQEPELINTAKCTLKEIEIDEGFIVDKSLTMKEALDFILQRKNKGIFVVNDEGKLDGIVSVSNLTSILTANEQELVALMSKVTLANIVKTLNATVLNEAVEFTCSGQVYLMPSLANNLKMLPKGIVIVGNNIEVQRFVIDAKASMIIICGENWVDNVTLEKAKENNVCILHTPLSALNCSQLIYQSPSIEHIMTHDVIRFNVNETTEAVSHKMAKTRYRTYPVVDDEHRVVGAISRYHLFNYEKKRFILVDHNEASQSVNDLEFGEVIEIVDHHRLGGIETSNPINITSKIVGCTCSIIAELYLLYNIPIPYGIAGLMLCAIISDTLNLKSPTTTDTDRKMGKMLEGIVGESMDEISQQMIYNSDSIINKTPLQLLYDDFKEFRISEYKIAIGQSQCKSKEEYDAIKESFKAYLEDTVKTNHYDLILIMFTDPMGSGSYFLYTGKKAWVIDEGFKEFMEDEFAHTLISRKKQVLPVIVELLSK